MSQTSAELIGSWFASKGWKPHAFQQDVWEAQAANEQGLIIAPTGSGKTYAAMASTLARAVLEETSGRKKAGVRMIWIAPIRALTKEIKLSAERLCEGFNLDWEVGTRTGDTLASEKARQRKQLPHVLITTPESLHVLLAMKGSGKRFLDLECLIVDEWHELLGTKRGVQVELAASWLRLQRPSLMVWGISATLGNPKEAMAALLGPGHAGKLIRAHWKKNIAVHSLMPSHLERLPWAGHLGLKLVDQVVDVIRNHGSTLIFTNTRSQSEIWYHKLLESAPDLAGTLALHHSSIAKELRDWVETALHEGELQAVVCTSSLDLGVDFRPVEAVVQIGGPKGVARFKQRAGRSGHSPHATSKVYFLPTHGLELIEAAALRDSIENERIEQRDPLIRSFDVLIQFLCTLAVGDGFDALETEKMVQSTHAFAMVEKDEFLWCMQFVCNGGESLAAYEEYKRVTVDDESGRYVLRDRRQARRHRMSIGTIVSDQMIKVKWKTGGFIGHVEEYFVASMEPGDCFWFAGMSLEFLRIKESIVQVKRSKKPKGRVPVYLGGRLSLSSELGHALRDELDAFGRGYIRSPEMARVSPLLELQQQMSELPFQDEILVEQFQTDDGHHLCFYPFEGRGVHQALGMLMAYRWSQFRPLSISISCNDYGFELLSDEPLILDEVVILNLLSTNDLMSDIQSGVNAAEMARRRFRDIAVIAGLAFQGFPGQHQGVKHLQSHSGLIFEVFREFDPENLLFRQAYDELIDQQMEWKRLKSVLDRLQHRVIKPSFPLHPTPFSFPLVVDRLREKLSSEQLEHRIKKMLADDLD
jgi:ATP-dependent Lhr-like helicase